MLPKTIYPRIANNSMVLVKNEMYNVHWLNLSRTYEFTHSNPKMNRIKTEQEVADMLLLKRIIVVSNPDLDNLKW